MSKPEKVAREMAQTLLQNHKWLSPFFGSDTILLVEKTGETIDCLCAARRAIGATSKVRAKP